MKIVDNPYWGTGFRSQDMAQAVMPSVAAELPAKLIKHCPEYSETPLLCAEDLADKFGVAGVFLKDERTRMGLGSFKALGATYVIVNEANARDGEISMWP